MRPLAAAATVGDVFIVEELAVNASFGATQARLARIVNAGGLTGPSHAAYEAGLTGLIRVGPLGDAPGVSKLVQVRFLDPVHRGATMTVPLRWEATGAAGGLFPVLDADLILAADGQDKTVIALAGCYRPPFGRLGAGLDQAILRHAAAATIRALLRSVADAIASPATAPHAAEDASPRWRLAPETGTPYVKPAGSLGECGARW